MRAAGGLPVPLADLLSPNFRQAPEVMFSEDRYHPSAVGYALAANQLLPALCHALGEWTGATVPDLPWATRSEVRALTDRLGPLMRLLRRKTTGVPAPIVVPAS